MLIRWTTLFLVLAAGLPAVAEPLFPPGSRIGLVPPPGMVVSKIFQGFEDREKNAAIVFVELSSEAYPDIEKGFTVEGLKAQSIDVQSREELSLKNGRGFMVMARQQVPGAPGALARKWALVATEDDLTAIVTVQIPDAAQDAYPDAALRASLATFTTRAAVPVQELLDLLPFSLNDLAGFRIVRAAASGAALLTDGPKDAIELTEQALLLITLAPGAPEQPADRESVARRAMSATPGVKDMRVIRSEAMRIGGQQGHEMLVGAKDTKTEADLTLVQWLRFGSGGTLRLLGAARKDQWDSIFPRLRAVRDGIEPK